jgi:hypothetical protein
MKKIKVNYEQIDGGDKKFLTSAEIISKTKKIKTMTINNSRIFNIF